MFPPTKRLNYFDHQFLRVDDFADEQAYHLGMRRAHNRLLHSPGVAQGLAVTHAGSTLTVSPGVALDGQGREIVLKEPVELDAPADAPTAWVTIAYEERPIEPTTETGAAGDRRCEEAPAVRVDAAPPGDPETRLVLARVTLAGGRVTGVDDGVATLHRRVAGPAPGAELEVRSLSVQGSATVGGTLGVERTLSVGEALSVGGPLAVGGTLTVERTLSVGGADGDATMNVPGGRAGGDLRVGTGDYRFDVGVEVTGIAAGTARLRAEGVAPRLVLGAGGTDVLTVQYGGVGIGAPPAEGYALNVGGVVNATDVLLDGQPLHASQWASVTGGITFNGGNVGVGLSMPRARLHVAGGRGDLGATEGDFKVGDETHRLKVGITTTGTDAGNVRVRAVGGTQKLMLGGGANDVLTVTETAVGVGTTAPGYRLHVLGTDRAVGTFESKTAETLLTLTTSEGVEKRVEFCNRSGGIAGIWTGGTGDALRVHRDGNVHIPKALAVGRAPAAGSTARLQLAGGSGDLEGTEGDVTVGSDTYRLKVGVTTAGTGAGDVRVRAVGGTGRLMLGAGGMDKISVTSDAVGFGTTAPTHPYHFKGSPDIALFESTGVDTYVRLISKEGIDNRVEFCNRPGGRATIWVAGAPDALYVERDGRVYVPGKLTAGTLALTSGAKPGFVIDHFVNRAGDTLEQGDVVVIGEAGATEYWATGNAIPIPEVDLSIQAYDRRVCGIVDSVVTQENLPHAEPRSPAKQPARTKGRRGKQAEADTAEGGAAAAGHPLAGYAAPGGEGGNPGEVGPGQLGSMVTLGAYAHCKVDADIAAIEVGDLLTTSPTRGHAQKVLDPAAAVGAIVGKALAPLRKGRGKIPVMVLFQ